MSLYNKYRPKSLSDIVGHEKSVSELKKRSKEDNFSHTMMFSGNSGLGKTTLQRIVAKNILCQNKDEEGNSCNTCDICKCIDEEKISNFYTEINASNLNIDEVRELAESAKKKNLSTVKRKVFVIDELQEMKKSQSALRTLLKPIESEIPNVYFILGTMQESDIPTSIKNRCVHYKLKDLSFEEIAQNLYSICTKEGIAIDTKEKADTLIAVAQNSDGSMRTAISYLERCIYSNIWDSKAIIEELGIVSNEGLITIINHLLTGNVKLFENDITKDILDRIRWILNVLYKSKAGVELNAYQKSFLKGIINVDAVFVSKIISRLNELTMLPYINQEMIDFALINILMMHEKGKSSEPEKPVVRERVRK